MAVFFPRKVKFRKAQRGRVNPLKKQVATRGNTLAFGSFGLRAGAPAEITVNQIEAARKTMSRSMEKAGKIWIRIFADKVITAKPPEVGMGKGKGDPQGYVAPIKTGTMIFEIDGVDEKKAREVFRKAGSKLPIKTKMVSRI